MNLELDPFRLMPAGNEQAVATMKRCADAATILITGRSGSDMSAPEPLVQVGFEPDDEEMQLLALGAEREGRDLVHVSCHADGVGGPTGMIAVMYFEDGKARCHRRCGLLCALGSSQVVLSRVSDAEDETCHFVLRPGVKMARVPGYPMKDIGAGMQRAGDIWLKLARSRLLGDCDSVMLTLYGKMQGARSPKGALPLSAKGRAAKQAME